MREGDFEVFSAMLDDVASLLPPAQPLSSTGRAMFFRAVSHLAISQVRAAFDAHVSDPQRGRFFPKPADLLAQVGDRDGRPGADEAWGIAVHGQDERATIVWTDEIAQAWGIARPVMQLGDEVGARMSFRDAYGRLVADARRAGKSVNWTASLGHDVEGRAVAISEAASLGRLSQGGGLVALPAPRDGGLAGLLESPQMPDHIREWLHRLRDQLTGERIDPQLEQPSQDALARARTEQLKGESRRKVDAYRRTFPAPDASLRDGRSDARRRHEPQPSEAPHGA